MILRVVIIEKIKQVTGAACPPLPVDNKKSPIKGLSR
jgi:hypothetical protein